jgi:hypothetical protein
MTGADVDLDDCGNGVTVLKLGNNAFQDGIVS